MSRNKTVNVPDLSVLLLPANPLMLGIEQAVLRGQEWSRATAPVADRVAVRIAGLITMDLIKAGQRLLENDISAVLRVSRAPVREALRILERERLVEFQARRGAIVTAPDARDLVDIYVVRHALYDILLRKLMEERPGDLDSLFETHVPKLRHAAGESADAYALASFALNFAMTEMCSNRVLVDLLVSISLRTLRYVRIGLASNPASIPGSLKSWEALRRAVAKRDMTLVLATARQRMDGSRDSAMRAMKPAADVTQKAGSGPKRSARAAQSRRPSTPQA